MGGYGHVSAFLIRGLRREKGEMERDQKASIQLAESNGISAMNQPVYDIKPEEGGVIGGPGLLSVRLVNDENS